MLNVDSDIKSGLVKLAEGMYISTMFDQQLCDVVMAVLGCPVKSGHLQHVFGVDVGTTLKQKKEYKRLLSVSSVDKLK